jgi:hypothetical protein
VLLATGVGFGLGAGVVAGLAGVEPTSTKKLDCFFGGATLAVGLGAAAAEGDFEAERRRGTPPANKFPKVFKLKKIKEYIIKKISRLWSSS